MKSRIDAIYAMQLGNIEHVAALLKAEYLRTLELPKSDVEFFILRIHAEAPSVLLALLESSWDNDDAIRALLYSYFVRALHDLRKRVWTERRFLIKGESAEIIIGNSSYETRESEEAAREDNLEVLAQALNRAPADVRALCLAYLKYREWKAAGKSLGWNPDKTWHVVEKVRNFFKKICTYRAGLLKLIPCKE